MKEVFYGVLTCAAVLLSVWLFLMGLRYIDSLGEISQELISECVLERYNTSHELYKESLHEVEAYCEHLVRVQDNETN